MGCATKQDLRRVQGELDQKITVTSNDIETLKEENESLRKSNKEAMDALRKSQADINADMTELKDRIQQLTGKSDEQRKDLSSLSVRTDHEVSDLKEKLERTSFKINFVENFLGWAKRTIYQRPLKRQSSRPTARRRKLRRGIRVKKQLMRQPLKHLKRVSPKRLG